MKKLLFLLLSFTLLISCVTKKFKSKLFSPVNLKSQFFSVDASKDTILKTEHGAVLLIPAKAFDVADGTSVAIEIKEALSSYEIMAAGLITESNGKPLSSGGMIYINATSDNRQLQLKLPINVSLPSKTSDTAMKVFKGEIKSDSSINWVDPVSLDTLIQSPEAEVNIAQPKADTAGKPVSTAIAEELRTDSMDKVVADTSKPGVKKPCGLDTTYIVKYEESQDYPEISPVYAPVDLPATEPTNELQKAETTEGLRNGFTDALGSYTGVYNFSIKTLGWYNVDAYVEGYIGSTYVTMTAQLQVQYEAEMNVYLFCPSRKMLSVSNKIDGDHYSFDKVDGKVPLFIKDRAILFAFGSYRDKMLYGISELFIQQEQVIKVSVKETTKEELLKIIGTKNLDGIDLQVIEKEMKVVPKDCDDHPVDKMDSPNMK